MKNALYIIVTALLMVGCGSGLRDSGGGGDDWLLFRGNAALDGTSNAHLPREPVLLWNHKSGSPALSSPVVADGIVYWSDRRGRIRGVDRAGLQVFDIDLATAVDAAPTIADGIIYIGRIDGVMSALSLADGRRMWDFETLGQISAPAGVTDFGGRRAIVFGSYDGTLYCVDALTGDKITGFESGYYLNGATAVSRGLAVFGGCDTWLRVIDTRTGRQTDSLMLDNYIPASPALADDRAYVGDHSGNISEVTIGDDGRITSHRKLLTAPEGGTTFVSVPAVTRRSVFVLADDRRLTAVDRATGDVRWRRLLPGATGESSPVVARDRVIVCTRTGVVSMIDAESGEIVWEYDTGEPITASPAVIEGRFYVLTNRGTLLCFGERRELQ